MRCRKRGSAVFIPKKRLRADFWDGHRIGGAKAVRLKCAMYVNIVKSQGEGYFVVNISNFRFDTYHSIMIPYRAVE
jgi:hypothetical protein